MNAFTQGKFELFSKSADMSFSDGFYNFMHKALMTFMEENYVQMYDIGIVGRATDHYYIVLFGAISTILLPVFMAASCLGMYKIVDMAQQNKK